MAEEARTRIRVLIVDDHAIVRAGLRMLLESQANLQVVGQAATSREALTSATQEQPDIILLDLDLGGESGLTLLPELRRVVPRARVIILTGTHDAALHQQAVQSGAMGVVLKDQAAEVLHTAITQVQAGGIWLDPGLTARVLAGMEAARVPDPGAADIAALTEREREVIALLAEGLQNKDVGERLHITENTVRRHLVAIFNKLGVDSRLELVIYAFRHGMVQPPR
jgi:DNA-binding NarL/FixJ family response regulator